MSNDGLLIFGVCSFPLRSAKLVVVASLACGYDPVHRYPPARIPWLVFDGVGMSSHPKDASVIFKRDQPVWEGTSWESLV